MCVYIYIYTTYIYIYIYIYIESPRSAEPMPAMYCNSHLCLNQAYHELSMAHYVYEAFMPF